MVATRAVNGHQLCYTDRMVLSLLACSSGIALKDGAYPTRPHPDLVEVVPGDTSPEEVEDSGLVEDEDDSVVFDRSVLHEVALVLPADSVASLGNDPYTFVPAGITFDGEEFPTVGARITGRLGSLRYLPSKSAFKIDFLEFGGDARLHGLDKINLHNMVQDCAKVSELAAYTINEMVGVPSPRVAYAHVTINGEDYGVYSVIEQYDDEFLKDRFADPSGNLYDGDYKLWPNGDYTLLDFNTVAQQYFQLDEGTDVALADVRAITDALQGGFPAASALIDVDEFAAFFAAAAWTGHYDSYAYYSNNYRFYFDPGRDGKAVFLPWDPDWAFYASTPLTSPYGVLAQGCLADVDCRAKVSANLATLSVEVPGGELPGEVQAAIDLIEYPLRDDPKRETAMPSVHGCQADLLDWFNRRGAEVAAYGL